MHRVALFVGPGDGYQQYVGALESNCVLCGILQETEGSTKRVLRRRVKRLGIFHVVGQLSFIGFVVPLLRVFSRRRVNELKGQPLCVNEHALTRVSNLNTHDCGKWVRGVGADIIILHGTRILSEKTIKGIALPVFNIHVGITPKYRGVHGGYWALASQDDYNFGVTLHIVDAGIDSGRVIDRRRLVPEAKDNYVTYPFLQQRAGLEMLVMAFGRTDPTRSVCSPLDIESKLWYHPTLWQYFKNLLLYGVK